MTSSAARRAAAASALALLLPLAVVVLACRRAAVPGSATAGSASHALPALQPANAEELLQAVRRPGAAAVLVNVWATWCIPCREEFPDLLRVHGELAPRGLRLLLVSADFADNADGARAFLARNGVDFPSFLKVGSDMEFIDRLSPEWSGALPATFLYDGEGNLKDFWEGKADYRTFSTRVLKVLDERG